MLHILMKLLGVDYKIEGLEDGELGDVFDSDNNKITGEMEEIVKTMLKHKLSNSIPAMDRLIKKLGHHFEEIDLRNK